MIRNKALKLVKEIQDYSMKNKAYWNKVPYLACMANGRTGWNDQLSRAAEQGYWAVNAVSGYYRIYVDLETGRLVTPLKLTNDANEEDILALAFQMDEIDAAKIAKELEEWAKEPYGSYYSGKQINEREENVKKTIKKFGLKPDSYKRKVSKKSIEDNNLVAGLMD
jgi:hypothetical protein